MNNGFEKNRESELMEARLWDYIDGLGDLSEKSAIQKLIAENVEWRARYHELLELHSTINLSELEAPSLRFTKNVMEEISRLYIAPATKSYINKKIIWGIAAFFITVITGFLVYGFSQVDWSSASSESPLGVDFTRVDYSSMFSNTYVNMFVMINIVLGLMLFDRYLNDKKKKLLGER